MDEKLRIFLENIEKIKTTRKGKHRVLYVEGYKLHTANKTLSAIDKTVYGIHIFKLTNAFELVIKNNKPDESWVELFCNYYEVKSVSANKGFDLDRYFRYVIDEYKKDKKAKRKAEKEKLKEKDNV